MGSSEHSRLHSQPYLEVVTTSCGYCGSDVQFKSTKRSKAKINYCDPKCQAAGSEIVDWPPLKVLQRMVVNNGFAGTGRVLGVSGNTVRKRLRNRGVDPKKLLEVRREMRLSAA